MVLDKKKEEFENPIFDLPKGRYRLIGWDIDITGRRLMDEICQVAAYYPGSKFAQYVMPHKDLNPFVERRYNIRVITVSRYRMLKDLKTNKLLKTKSEISALTDFISWLEKNKGNSNDGIILLYHEVKKIVPSLFLQALKRYELLDRFSAVVKGFCNTCTLAEITCSQTLKSFSLKVLSRVLLDEEDDSYRSAANRAKAYYNIVQRIKENDDSDSDCSDVVVTEKELADFARQYTRSTEAEEKELMELKDFLERLNSFRPVFKELMRYDWVSRQNASRLRSKLAENNLHLDQLQNAWDNGGKESIIQILRKVSTTRKKDFADLLKILDCYFDPTKKPVNPNFYKRRKTFTSKAHKSDEQEKENNSRVFGEFSPNSDDSSPQSDDM